MRILVLGGTRFVGRHLVTECLARGDDVTVFYRARSPSPFTGVVRHVVSDRRAPTSQAKSALAEPWDAVVDTSATDLDDVRHTTWLLRRASRYILVSSCGVYSRNRRPSAEITERSPVIRASPTDPIRASATRRLRCERFLRRHSERTGVPLLIVRLGLVVGAHDYSDRLAYWLERVLHGGDMLIPMDPTQPVQLVDATDVARYLRDTLDDDAAGVVNVAGPRTTARNLIETLATRTGCSATPHWVGEGFALSNGLRPWTQIPLWLPARHPERELMYVSSRQAEVSGLTYTPLTDTLAVCLTWQELRRGWSQRWLDHVYEQHLLSQWRR